MAAAGRWCAAHWPELSILAFGISLRISMAFTYELSLGYDYSYHLRYVEILFERGELPRLDETIEAYHPPLSYLLATALMKLGLRGQSLIVLPVACGILRLGLFWYGFSKYLPTSRVARLVAMWVAAVLPSSVHLDGMLTGEALQNLLAVATLVLVPRAFEAEGKKRYWWTLPIGLLVGLALLTKVSALVIFGAIGLGALIELARRRADGLRPMMGRLMPWLAGAAVIALTVSPYAIYNLQRVGKPFLTSLDVPGWESIPKTPYLDRRTLGYFVSWSAELYALPFYPSASQPHARFLPVAIVSTFVDYYHYNFARPAHGRGDAIVNGKAFDTRTMPFAVGSAVAGTAIAFAVIAAWFGAWIFLWRSRDHGRLTLLLVPLVALAGQLHFAISLPFDHQGVVKGLYMQFGCSPLYALVGVAAAWLWTRRASKVHLGAFAGLIVALGVVGVYAVFCRFVIPVLGGARSFAPFG